MKHNSKLSRQDFHQLVKKYRKDIAKQANKVLSVYKWIPLEKEDLINESLFNINKFINEFDTNQSSNLRAYVVKKSYYFMMNVARKYTAKKFQSMNNYIDYSLINNVKKFSQNHYFPEANEVKITTSQLTVLEKNVFELFFIQEQSMKIVAEKLSIPIRSVANTIFRIRKKFRQTSNHSS